MAEVVVEKIRKVYADKVAVSDVSFEVDEGEFVSLLGPSGCGKTTTLNMIAGFTVPDSGKISLSGKDVTRTAPYARDTAMVFQSYALFPHMRVFDNVAFGLRARRLPSHEIKTRVEEVLSLLGLAELGSRYPRQLSGGQQQRVAVARSLVVRPAVLLMDEPLSNLDAKLRQEIRVELRNLQQRLKQTIIFVTHDQEEAFAISDRVIVMREGDIVQMGAPQDLFDHPRTRFVADFVGIRNIFAGHPENGGFQTKDGLFLPGIEAKDGQCVGIRALAMELLPPGETVAGEDGITLSGTIDSRIYLGDTMRYYVQISERAQPLVVDVSSIRGGEARQEGDDVVVKIPIGNLLLLDEA